METVITPPIIVVDREGWISIFDSVNAAEAEIEAPDVESDEYLVFDSRAHLLRFVVIEEGMPLRWLSRLRVQSALRLEVRDPRPRAEPLRTILLEALRGECEIRDASARRLVELAATLRSKDLRASAAVAQIRETDG